VDAAFTRFVETLHPSFERLMQMAPLKMSALPAKLPEKCIYLLGEGENYLYGHHVPQDCGRARHNLMSAAESANPRAQILLGTMYATGHCVPRNMPMAYRWFTQAHNEDPRNTRVEQDLRLVWNQMTAQEQNAASATEEQRKLAYEEILIAEGSDWNWWYGPEHHSANDRDFDELYRKHLANVYHALGAMPPDYLVQPITASAGRPAFIAQANFIRPRIDGEITRYFEWMGAAMYTADMRAGAMHGKQYFLDSVYAGVDEHFLYGRVDFAGGVPGMSFDLVINMESQAGKSSEAHRKLRLDASVENKALQSWSVTNPQSGAQIAVQNADAAHSEKSPVQVAIKKVFEFRVPLEWLRAPMANQGPQADRLGLRVSIWHDRLPVDALPVEGSIELQLVSEAELMSGVPCS